MESTLQKPALVAAETTPKAKTIVYWIVTALFCLQISFTAYAQLRLPLGLRRLRHHPRLCAPRPPLGGRWPGGVGLGGDHRRALGALVLLLAPPAGHAVGEIMTAKRAPNSSICDIVRSCLKNLVGPPGFEPGTKGL